MSNELFKKFETKYPNKLNKEDKLLYENFEWECPQEDLLEIHIKSKGNVVVFRELMEIKGMEIFLKEKKKNIEINIMNQVIEIEKSINSKWYNDNFCAM